MASNILTLAIIFLMSITAIYFVLNSGNTVIDSAKSYSDFNDAKNSFNYIDNVLKVVSSEGYGSKRELNTYFTSPVDVLNKSRFIQTKIPVFSDSIEYGSRVLKGNIAYIYGSDANCYEADVNNDGSIDYVMENSFIKFGLQKINGPIDTKNNIVFIKNNVNNDFILPKNTSIVIDDNVSSSVGSGYSEMDLIKNAPLCVTHFYIDSNSGVKYDIYYKLYSFADFAVIEVKNIN